MTTEVLLRRLLIIVLFISFLLTGNKAISAFQGDLNGDDYINLEDLAEFASQWLGDPTGSANFDGDGNVDADDLFVLVNNWLVRAESVIINEFMAANNDSLFDGNGESSDWIELYNAGTQDIDLTGWFLTDGAGNLTKWPFPEVTINSNTYMIIFASGRDDTEYPYLDSSGYYHTNFKLTSDGEYLALVKADGVTIASEYNNYEFDDGTLGYPPQDTDISYGNASTLITDTTLVSEDAEKAVLVPTSDIGTTWTGGSEPFVDSAWDNYTFVSGTAGGVGFDSAITYDSYISYNIASGSVGCYIRIPFEIDDPSSYSGLTLKVRYDDGFIAYLNGIEVASANAPATPAYNSTASALHPDAQAVSFEEFDISAYSSQLLAGENILAIHGLNQSSSSSDFLISVKVDGMVTSESGTSAPMYFETPTPGAANADAYIDYVDAPKISQDHGFFTDPFQVGISCSDEDAIIRYTTDGSEPSMSNGTVYTDWITISTTTCLRAVAYRAESGYLASRVKTATYLFLDDVISQSATPPTGWPTSSVNGQVYDYEMDPDVTSDSRYADLMDNALLAIPTISLVIDLEDFVSSSTGIYSNPQSDGIDWERPVSVELINPDGSDGFQCNGGLRIRGGMSRMVSNPKHSFRLFFRSEYGDSKLEYPLFEDEGVDEFDKIDLRTGQNFSWNLAMGGGFPGGSGDSDATWLYDIFTRDSHREMEQPYSRGRYYHVYINGLYWGLFQTDERPSASYGESYFGGDKDDYDTIKSDNDTGAIYATDGVTDDYFALWTEVNSGVSSNSDYFRIQGMNADGTVNSTYTRYLDVENLIDYMIIVFYAGNRDMPLGPPGGDRQPRNLFGVYNRENPDGFQYVAHDSEQTLITAGVSIDRVNLSLASSLATQANFNPVWLHQQLMSNDEYLMTFADHVHKYFFNSGILTPDACTTRWLARAYEINTAMIAESARWGDYTVTTPRTVDDDWWPAVNDNIDNFFEASTPRTDIVLSQLQTAGLYPTVSAPVFSQFGGQVNSGYSLTMSAAAGTIYYTTDGTDPRTIGGAVAATASIYSSALTINHSMTVKARALSGGVWSALNEATFAVGDIVNSLRVTEIMYHPNDPVSVADPNTEYIELQNVSGNTINLNMVNFADGIDFTFGNVNLAPNAYVLVVQSQSQFEARYGSSLNVAGEYTGQLDNAGEDIELQDALGNTIQRFDYEDDWYSITDGDGYSLTIIDPTASDPNLWDSKDGWRSSVYVDGSPDDDDSADAHNPGSVVINEVLAHTDSYPNDQIELYNTTDTAIDIGGWFLSDSDASDAALMKYEIPSGTTIPAGGYVVFTQDDDFGAYFALSENGDNVYLTSELDTGGKLTGYRNQEDFGASESEVAFGRHLKSTGTYNFVAMSSNTLDSPNANAAPKVGPIVITEIMYHPDWLVGSNYNNDEFEYVELYNNSGSAVTLYDSSTSVSWKFTEGIDYTFSTDSPVTIPAGGYIVVTKNPTAFSTRYPSVSSSIIYGPYDGKLQNDGEKLELSMPGDVDEDGQRCYIRVDRAVYDDGSNVTEYWPAAADGMGSSLTRQDPDAYGNDPANWQAATPTPGQ